MSIPHKQRQSHTVGPKSLNIHVRKLENERIERENHAFAKRLFDKSGSISKKRLENEWVSQVKYKKIVEKVRPKKISTQKIWLVVKASSCSI